MATLKLKLTKEHLALISNIRFQELPKDDPNKKYINWGIDYNSLYGGSYLLEDISYILGIYDKRLTETTDEAMGPRFPQDLEDHMFELHDFIMHNLDKIEEIVHQFSVKGGIEPGTYKCKDYQRIWEKV